MPNSLLAQSVGDARWKYHLSFSESLSLLPCMEVILWNWADLII